MKARRKRTPEQRQVSTPGVRPNLKGVRLADALCRFVELAE
jgi:hypothetical protein